MPSHIFISRLSLIYLESEGSISVCAGSFLGAEQAVYYKTPLLQICCCCNNCVYIDKRALTCLVIKLEPLNDDHMLIYVIYRDQKLYSGKTPTVGDERKKIFGFGL